MPDFLSGDDLKEEVELIRMFAQVSVRFICPVRGCTQYPERRKAFPDGRRFQTHAYWPFRIFRHFCTHRHMMVMVSKVE